MMLPNKHGAINHNHEVQVSLWTSVPQSLQAKTKTAYKTSTFYIVSNIFLRFFYRSIQNTRSSAELSPTKIAAFQIKRFIRISHLPQYFALSQSTCQKPLQILSCLSVCPVVCPHGTKQRPPDELSLGFLLKFIDTLRL